jgi:hypothetical protein
MDDYSMSSLHESKNEWGMRLLNILTPLVVEGFQSIFNDAVKLCINNNEEEKYLMTFQNFITRIPSWNPEIIEQETQRIVDSSHCSYLEDLISCVHIIHLKSLTCMRVGSKQKKIEINVPSLKDFIHKVYINCARKLYSNVYLFENNIESLQIQKHNREKELIIKESILNTLRENIPVEQLLRSYLDEGIEELIEHEEKEEIIRKEPIIDEKPKQEENSLENKEKETATLGLSNEKSLVPVDFSSKTEDEKQKENVNISFAPLPEKNFESGSVNDDLDIDDDEDLIKIGDNVNLDTLDVQDLENSVKINQEEDLLKNEIEILT